MECQKVCKQGRDDIIVKVSLQSPIPTSFYITVANLCENDIPPVTAHTLSKKAEISIFLSMFHLKRVLLYRYIATCTLIPRGCDLVLKHGN